MKVKCGSSWAMLLCVSLLVTAASGCASKRDKNLNGEGGIQQDGHALDDSSVEGDGLGGVNVGEGGLSVVYFDYDSAVLKPEAVALLQQDADRIRQGGQVQFQIEGHCDERGTQEYNLALGEQRALAVKNTLVRLGVNPDQLATISYGEERPAESGQTETAYAKNRRAQLNNPS